MKILLISRFFPYIGGRESIVLLLAEELSKEHEVAVLTPDMGRASEKYQVIHYSEESLKEEIDKFSPDIISSHTFYLTPKVIEAIDGKYPITLTLHGDLLNFGSESDKKMFLGMVPKLNKVIAVCDHGQKQLSEKGEIGPDKLTMIKYGIDNTVFTPRSINTKSLRDALRLQQNKFIFFTPARMTYYKGIEFLIDSIESLKKYEDQIHFLVGTPPSRHREDEVEYTQKILKIVEDKGLNKMFNIGFYDFVSMPLLYNAVDAFILPSKTEQLPISILEALSSGLPVIATNVGGVSEMISTGRTGELIEYGDISALTQSIKKIYQDSEYNRILHENNPKVVGKLFNKERMVTEYEQLFRKLQK